MNLREFWLFVDFDPDDTERCWEYNGYRGPHGYGFVTLDGDRSYGAHRLAYLTLVGPIPEGMVLDHLCRNRACCNPRHLEPVTRSENQQRTLPYLKPRRPKVSS